MTRNTYLEHQWLLYDGASSTVKSWKGKKEEEIYYSTGNKFIAKPSQRRPKTSGTLTPLPKAGELTQLEWKKRHWIRYLIHQDPLRQISRTLQGSLPRNEAQIINKEAQKLVIPFPTLQVKARLPLPPLQLQPSPKGVSKQLENKRDKPQSS